METVTTKDARMVSGAGDGSEVGMKSVGRDGVVGSAFRLLLATFVLAVVVSCVTAGGQAVAPPSGTILPVRLNVTISSGKSKPGQEVTGKIMQEVPLASGEKIRKGSKVIGHIVEVIPAAGGKPARVSVQFDKLVSSNESIPIVTNLRAIAGFMQISEAQIPTSGPGESDVYNWLTKMQVGGDTVYGLWGDVGASENADKIVGKSVGDGVLAKVRAKEGTKCRGAVDGNDSPQALWVFSTDACGVYGMEHVFISHAGRTEPRGVIVFASDNGNVKIAGGAGMLLRVVGGKKSLEL
jgi:hypothetical protein